MGKAIEPAISPLGYDWKIGIAIISSFAVEFFVGTLATIYSVGGAIMKLPSKTKWHRVIHYWRKKDFNFCLWNVSLLLFFALPYSNVPVR
jgi:ferrous iron transport protein B